MAEVVPEPVVPEPEVEVEVEADDVSGRGLQAQLL